MKVAMKKICAVSPHTSLQCFRNKITTVFASPACTDLKQNNTKDVKKGIRFHGSQLVDLWYPEKERLEGGFEMGG